MAQLADTVLPLVRTRADLHRWSAADADGRQVHAAVDLLEAAGDTPAAERLAVCQKAITSAVPVLLRADDSSGVLGDAVRRLLGLHARLAAQAAPPAGRLVDWLIAFQFDGRQDFFEIDPVAYAPALGESGPRRYRDRLRELTDRLGPAPSEADRWSDPDAGTRFTLEWNAKRLAVLDRDVDAIIATHARDRAVAAWLQDTAEALAKIGETDLAIDWARQATDHDGGHQSRKAADHWCALLAQHRPEQLLPARRAVFDRWPSSSTAAALHAAAGDGWGEHRDHVLQRLRAQPREAVLFALLHLSDPALAWTLAHELDLRDSDVWGRLLTTYDALDPLSTLPVHRRLVVDLLVHADAADYRRAAKRLARMRELVSGTTQAPEVDAFLAELRTTHRRRPRLLQELDRAGLP